MSSVFLPRWQRRCSAKKTSSSDVIPRSRKPCESSSRRESLLDRTAERELSARRQFAGGIVVVGITLSLWFPGSHEEMIAHADADIGGHGDRLLGRVAGAREEVRIVELAVPQGE